MAKLEKKIQPAVIELLPRVITLLQTIPAIRDAGNAQLSGGVLARGFIAKLLATTLHRENLIDIIIALRDIPESVFEQSVNLITKKLEDVPTKSLPAAIYQLLQWCRSCPKEHGRCFETIFAVIEAKCEKIEVGECLAHIRLALSHERELMNSFIKEAKRMLQHGVEVSPYLLLLLLGSEGESVESVKHVEHFIADVLSTSYAAEKRGILTDLELSKWPKIERLLTRLLSVVQSDDEISIRSILQLAFNLMNRNVNNVTVRTAISAIGSKLLLDGYGSFSVARGRDP